MAVAPVIFGATWDRRQGKSKAEQFSEWAPDRQARGWAKLTEQERADLVMAWADWWARPNQILPAGAWQTWLIMAGRGFGKTRTGAETVRLWSKSHALVNIIAPTADDARDICIEGESGVLRVCPDNERPKYLPSKRRLEWPNGAVSLIFTADEPERLRGKQHMKLWADELAAWRYLDEAWTQASLGLRLGVNPQAIVTTTPKPLPIVKELVRNATTFVTTGTTYDNRRNLAEAFFTRIIIKYEGTRLGRQELNAELLEDNPNALFQRALIEETRIGADLFWQQLHAKLKRIVGAIDPAVTSTAESDETGIVFAGLLAWEDVPPELKKLCKHESAHFVVFDDRSNIYTPDGWAKAAIAGYRQFKADRLVGEVNNGGEMVESTLRHTDLDVAYTAVHASRGKQTRAEPISALYEQHRVHHVGNLAVLEDQMCDYDPNTTTDSPDRMDADVWALTELSENLKTLGLLEWVKKGGPEAMMEATDPRNMQKIVRAQQLAKPVVADAAAECPSCGMKGALIQTISGGQKRCGQCGEQWGTAQTSITPELRKML